MPKKRPSVVVPSRIVPPAALSHHEQKVWDEYIKTPWLTKYDAVNLHMYCCALAKYKLHPQGASNSLISRMKSLGTKLRFDDPPNQKSHLKLFDDEPESPEERVRRERAKKVFDDEDT